VATKNKICKFQQLGKMSIDSNIFHTSVSNKCIAVRTVATLFLYLYVHSVEDSTLMPIFDQFSLSFVLLGLPKIGPNRYT